MLERFIPYLTKDEAEIIENLMVAKEAPTGTILIEQGARDRNMFFIVSGTYEVYQKIIIASAYHAVKIATTTGPTLFGEASLLSNQERNASVVVQDDCRYLELSYENFKELSNSQPDIALKLVTYAGSIIAERYLNLHNQLQDKLFADADNFQKGLLWMRKYLGDVQKCPAETAKKLFKI